MPAELHLFVIMESLMIYSETLFKSRGLLLQLLLSMISVINVECYELSNPPAEKCNGTNCVPLNAKQLEQQSTPLC